jgi:hypothetical protein
MPDDLIEPENPTEGMPVEGEASAPAPQEPGTEAEGIESDASATSEVTQEAPVMDDAPVVEEGAGREPPQVPAFAIEYKPRSDIYTLILIFSFMIFTTIAILAGKEAYDFYDCEFWMFKKETADERKAREEQEARERGGAEAPAPAPAPGGTPAPGGENK